MTTLTIYQKDKGFALDFVIKDEDDVVVNLTTATVTFKVGNPGEGLLINSACVVTNAAAGEVRYTIGANDLLIPGRYKGELKVTYSTSKIITINTMDVEIRSSL